MMPTFFIGMICGAFCALALVGAMEWGHRNDDDCQGCRFKEMAEEEMYDSDED